MEAQKAKQNLIANFEATLAQIHNKISDQIVELNAGEMIVVPKGKKHKPFANEEAKIMLVEPRGIINTGDIESDLTAKNDQWI